MNAVMGALRIMLNRMLPSMPDAPAERYTRVVKFFGWWTAWAPTIFYSLVVLLLLYHVLIHRRDGDMLKSLAEDVTTIKERLR